VCDQLAVEGRASSPVKRGAVRQTARGQSKSELASAYLYTESPQSLQFAEEEGFMNIPRLLLVSLLILVCFAPIAAQSLPDKIPASSQPQLDGLVAPPEFRANVPPVPQIAQDRIRATPMQQVTRFRFSLKPEQNDATCFYIRSYRVTRDDPASDSTRLAGYSECQPAARYRAKNALFLEIAPR
jgi:hypothetical protein